MSNKFSANKKTIIHWPLHTNAPKLGTRRFPAQSTTRPIKAIIIATSDPFTDQIQAPFQTIQSARYPPEYYPSESGFRKFGFGFYHNRWVAIMIW